MCAFRSAALACKKHRLKLDELAYGETVYIADFWKIT
jgi:hypothetical protein